MLAFETEIRFQDRTYGHSCVRLCPSLCPELSKGGIAVNLEVSVNYYYATLALRLLLERGLISEDEYGKICRYNAEFFKPGREYI